eukprot:NODE_5449_length_1013_cov_43.426966_g4880_i0.p1 GENE.NODE_5449_length_1013_cov_43.426966_g4880_i0~~NODE_5449_length_1013_cov_43.426966_g4880_i0.p1  ORF type:complete len:270 (+),score=51.48 NODE_5449_length_1013_cov_43.426966_g4880_i0:60-869(+)
MFELVPLDEGLKTIALRSGSNVVGRTEVGVSDPKMSRRQVIIETTDDASVKVYLEGLNPSTLLSGNKSEVMKRQNTPYMMNYGDIIYIVGKKYKYTLQKVKLITSTPTDEEKSTPSDPVAVLSPNCKCSKLDEVLEEITNLRNRVETLEKRLQKYECENFVSPKRRRIGTQETARDQLSQDQFCSSSDTLNQLLDNFHCDDEVGGDLNEPSSIRIPTIISTRGDPSLVRANVTASLIPREFPNPNYHPPALSQVSQEICYEHEEFQTNV